MRVLVTGGAGYIGSHTVRHLLEYGHEVTVFDNLSKGHAASVPADILVEGSLSDSARLDHILVTLRIQAVIHFAAFAQVGESVQQPDLYYRNNVLGTFNLLDAMEKAGVRRMVFFQHLRDVWHSRIDANCRGHTSKPYQPIWPNQAHGGMDA